MFSYLFGLKGKSGYGSSSTAGEIAHAYKDNLEGKVAIVTGCNTGIGKETVRSLAINGVKVYMACRTVSKMQAAIDDIKASHPDVDIIGMELDLGSLDSVRKFAKEFKALNSPLHLLINNAGVMACPLTKTKDGFEMQFGTNHLGHFLLTELLLDTLKATGNSRIVNLASIGHNLAYKEGIRFDDLEGEEYYEKWQAYGQSKLANIVYANELNKRLKAEGATVTANAVHPGVIHTDLYRHNAILDPLMKIFGFIFHKSIPQGAATTLYVAASTDIEGVGGKYWSDCNEDKVGRKCAFDDEFMQKLYDVSAKKVNL